MNALRRTAPALAATVAMAGCAGTAHHPVNPPLAHYDPGSGFRLEKVAADPGTARDVLLVLLL